MKKDFRDMLLADASLVALLGQVGGRAAIDFVIRPDLAALPSLTIEGVSEVRSYNQATTSGRPSDRFQIDIWGATYKETEDVHVVLRARCEAFTGVQGSTYFQRIFQDAARDLPVTDMPGGQRVFHRAVDFIIHYQET